jgi:16S rRNA (adenine1518-N6/adenine1519-N6)-dimethyltransferase
VHDRSFFAVAMTRVQQSTRRPREAPPREAPPDDASAARRHADSAALHPARSLNVAGRGARRRLSQNFLASPSVAAAIVRAADLGTHDTVLEIGPGLGVLTRFLVAAAARVVAVELDADLAAELPARLGHPANLQVIAGDALTTDLAALLAAPFTVVANLPYHVASPILFRLLFTPPYPSRIVAMLQEEVAERVVAQRPPISYPGAAVATVAEARIVRRVAPGSFFPVPKVRSAVVRLDRRLEPLVPATDVAPFVDFLRAGFSQPRKQLHNSLAVGLGSAVGVAARLAAAANVDPCLRPHQLSLDEWVALFDAQRRTAPVGETA